jgi:ribose transport system permease protein
MSELAALGRIHDKLTRDRRRTLVAFAFAVIVFVVGAFLHSGFANWGSVSAILEVASFVGFVAAGQTFVILVGGIDLSVPWVLNSAGILFAVFSLGHSGRAVPAVLLALGLGFVIGAVNGFCIAYLVVPAVVMTLAMNGIMEGLTLGLTKGLTCVRCNSYAPRVLQDVVHKDLLGIPADLILWFGVAALASVVLAFTTYGRKVYATGNNPTAAYLAGVNVRLVTMSLYGLSGMFAALAGIVLVSYSGQPTLGMGDPYLFQSIAAAVIGGISILGGRGNYLGTVAGAVSLVALISLLEAENMPDYGRSIVYGVAILVVLVLFGREERV